MNHKGIETIVKDQALVDRRHAQICDAALKLFSQKGFHQTSVREIAGATGLGTGTLYSYIQRKEDILTLLYRRILAAFEARMREATRGIEDPRRQLQAALEATLRIYDEYRDEVLLLYRESHAVGREGLEALFEVDRTYVGFFREILGRGGPAGAVSRSGPGSARGVHPVPVRRLAVEALESEGVHPGHGDAGLGSPLAGRGRHPESAGAGRGVSGGRPPGQPACP
jgi:TetR/AcrR family transcriptional regulator, cholesterol catabolism regulator